MFTASSTLVRARKYFIPTRRRSQKKRIPSLNKKKNKYRYYYGDRDFYRNQYLQSEHWKALRAAKLFLNSSCEECGSNKRIEPHHLQYRNLYDVELSDLKSLCRKCHNKVHKCA